MSCDCSRQKGKIISVTGVLRITDNRKKRIR